MHYEGQRIGQYILVRPIGSGGMGDVWLARGVSNGQEYALKLPLPRLVKDASFRRAFQREAEAQFSLSHPNIVRAVDWIDEEEHLGLVLEYIPGENLETRLYGSNEIRPVQAAPLSLDAACRVSVQILDALDTAHRRQWIHRDVKASNILLSAADGRALLTDFGIGLNLGGTRRTTTGVVAHTVWYMSPEQIRRPKEVDHRTDVYSFGCVLYEMLTGRPPFDADPYEDGDADFLIKRKHLEEAPKPPREWNPELPEQVQAVVLTALAKSPGDRFSGCGEFIAALQEAAAWGNHKAASAAAGASGGTFSAAPERRQTEPPAQESRFTAGGSRAAVVVEPEVSSRKPDRPPVERAPDIANPVAPSGGGRLWIWVAVACAIALGVIGAATYESWGNRAEKRWTVTSRNSLEELRAFRAAYPSSPRAAEANRLIVEISGKLTRDLQWKTWNGWGKASASDVEDYLRIHSGEEPETRARALLERLRERERAGKSAPAPAPPVAMPRRSPGTRPATTPSAGVLFVSSQPHGARIWIDGNLQNVRTNARIKLAYGRHAVVVQLPDGRVHNYTVPMSQGIQHLDIK